MTRPHRRLRNDPGHRATKTFSPARELAIVGVMTDQKHNLDDLPNLGKTTLMWLQAIGIRTAEALAQKGVFWAYVEMRKRGFRVTTAVLFSLEGALRNLPWRSFDSDTKQALLDGLAEYEQQQTATQLTLPLDRPSIDRPADGSRTRERARPRAASRHRSGRSGHRKRQPSIDR